MTANELADELGNILTFLEIEYENYEDDEILKQAATMLRKQQAEIEKLKTIRGNSVLVPSDKLQAMQAEIEALKKELALQRLSNFTQDIEHAMICTKCNNTGWVCECHPNKEAHKCCGGAGMPCECTKKSE